RNTMTNTMLFALPARKSRLARLNLIAILLLLAVAPIANAQAVTLLNRTLVNTDFQTQNVVVGTGCATLGCTGVPAPIFPTRNAMFPVAMGKPCTFYIHLESKDHFLSPLDAGLFQFLVDGLVPNPGPTFGSFFTWDNNDPTSPTAVPQSHSYAVT